MDALKAIDEIIQFEKNLMLQHGFAPWDDPNARQISGNAARAAGSAMGRAARERRELTAKERSAIEDHEVKRKRMLARILWERLIKTREKLQK